MYVPMLRGLFVHREIAADAEDMIVPDTKPKRTEYTMMAILVLGSLIQNTMIPVEIPANANVFSLPNLSARIPGMTRPKVDEALIIASRYDANVMLIPFETAYTGV